MDSLLAMRIYVRVVETGSFSRAAAEFGATQPTATKAVAETEKRLGARLLHRSTRGVTATEAGTLYYERCKRIVDEVDAAENLTTLLQGQLAGSLRISTSVAFGRRVMAPLVIRYLHEHPQAVVDLSFEDRYVNLVEQGVDVAMRMGRLADSSLGARYLGANPWAMVAAPAYLEQRGTPKRVADLSKHQALVYSSVQGDDRWNVTPPGRGGTQTVEVHGPLRSNNLTTLLAAACDGMGLAILPRYVAHEALTQGRIVEVMGDHGLPAQDLHAVFPSPRLVPAKVTHFIDWLKPRFDGAWWERGGAQRCAAQAYTDRSFEGT